MLRRRFYSIWYKKYSFVVPLILDRLIINIHHVFDRVSLVNQLSRNFALPGSGLPKVRGWLLHGAPCTALDNCKLSFSLTLGQEE